MTSEVPMSALLNVSIFALTLLSIAPPLQRPAAASAAQTPTGAVSLIGCVERVPAAQGAPATAQPTFKLIEVQPGPGTTMSMKVDTQFLLAAGKPSATPIDLGKFQNQRVEVTGTIAPAPPAKANPQTKPGDTTAPLPTLTLTSLKLVSTECK